jgi:type I restriction enzyme S subunit
LTIIVNVPLSKVCDIVGGSQPPKTDFIYQDKPEYIRLIQIQDYKSDKRKTYIPKSKAKRFCSKEDIMIGRYGPPIFQILRGLDGAYNVALMKASPKDDKVLDREYLYYFLQNKSLLDYIISNSERTAGQDGVRKELLDEYPIPLPPLEEQKRIVAIAQKADRLRRTRRYALQLSDTYLRSVFLQMFGDARTNPNNFPIEPLGDSLEKFESGVNFNPVSEREPASQWRVLKVSAVTSGVFEPYESKPIKPDVTFNDTLVVKKGDLLMSRANTRELVGAICMVREQPPKVLLPDKLWRVKFSKHSKLEPNYVLYALRQPKLRKIIADMASGTSGSMKNISKDQAATLPILIPPFALQEKFAQIVQKFDRLRTQQREAERQAEHLFQTILHRAFRGELTSQNADDEPESVLLEEIRAQQAKAEAEAKTATQAMGDAAEYLGTKAKQQDIEPIQLKFPGFE